MATYTLISSNVLSSSTTSVTFSSIPATYTDLVVRASIRSVANGTNIRVKVNNLTTSIYSSTFVFGDSTTAYSGRKSTATYLILDDNSVPNSSTASTFNSFELYLPSYTASQNKPLASFYTQENNASTAGSSYISANAGLIRTTAAITEIYFDLESLGSIATGSSFYLYVISNA